MTTVDVHDLHLNYRSRLGAVRALRGADLRVPAGALVAVLGPSGSGKTTLLRAIAGFVRPDRGTVHVGDRLVAGPGSHVPPERRRVTVVPQEGALFPHLSVAANVAFGIGRTGRGARVAELLDLVGLAGYERRMPHELSGGQQQRIALARALAPSPGVVLLDEPFSSLDAGLRAELRSMVRRTLREAGTTGVLVTHDQEEALSIADSVAVMRAGRIAQHATPIDVYARPADLGVATFVGETIVVPGSAAGATATTPIGELPLHAVPAAGGTGSVVVRPEQVGLTHPDAPGLSGEVVAIAFVGHTTRVEVRLDRAATGEPLTLAARLPGAVTTWRPGDRVSLTIRGAVTYFPDAEPEAGPEADPRTVPDAVLHAERVT